MSEQAKIIPLFGRHDLPPESELATELAELEWDIQAKYVELELKERRREDILRSMGRLGVERGVGHE